MLRFMNHELFLPVEDIKSNFSQQAGLRRIARNLHVLQEPRRVALDDALGTVDSYFENIIKNIPQGSRAVYWLARCYPVFLDQAECAIKKGDISPGELEEARERFSHLRSSVQEKPVSYRPQGESIFHMDEQIERTIFNAIRYNDSGRELFILPEAVLPEIPGHVSLSITQQGDRWGVNLYMKSARINVEGEKKANDEFNSFFGERYMVDPQENPALYNMSQDLTDNEALNMALGALRFSQFKGYKQREQIRIGEELRGFSQSIGTVLGPKYRADFYSAGQEDVDVRILNEETDVDYLLQYEQLSEESQYSISAGLVLRKREGSLSGTKRLTSDYNQFQADLKDELKFAGGIIDWIYQRSGVSTDYKIPLQTPDSGLLDWIEENSLLERLRSSPNTLTDLGGQERLKAEVAQDARNFISVYYGRGESLKPQNTIFYGPTGIGKSAFENAIAAHLLTARVPVYALKGDLFAQALQADVKKSVDELKRVFFYTLMHGGALMIRDFDALLGTRNDPRYTVVEGVLLSELQRIKEEPSTWLIADTQFIGRIPEALINAHRIGKRREVPLETDQSGIEQIIKALVRKIDKERFQKAKPLEYSEVETKYPIDYSLIALKIQNRGGMIPAQIERLVREEIQLRQGGPVPLETTSLIEGVDRYFEDEENMAALRKVQTAGEQAERIGYALTLAEQAIEGQGQIRDEMEGLKRQIEMVKSLLARRYSDDQVDGLLDKLWYKISEIENRLPKRKK